MLRSLRLRLTIGALIAIGLSLFMVWFALSRLFTAYVSQQYHQEMTVIADSLAAQVAFVDGKLTLQKEPADPRFNLPAGGRYWQIDTPGQKWLRSRSLWDSEINHAALAESGYSDLKRIAGPTGSPMLVYVLDSSIEENGKTYAFTITTGFEQNELDHALVTFHDELRRMLLATSGLLLVAAFLQGALGLAPLQRLKSAVADIRSGQSHHIGEDVPREVQPLVKEINLLIRERETALERARARASDLAHGLKTPLTVLSHLVESLPPEERDTALKQVELIRQRSDRQLQAARMGVEQMATTEVSGLVSRLVQVLRPMTIEREIEWQVDVPEGMTIGIDAADLAEATGNILDNAAKWARSRIRITAVDKGQDVEIRIGDDGAGIAEDERTNVLKRGHRLVDAASGHGLGLAISQDIARAYGGRIDIGQSELGGALVILSLPKKPAVARQSAPV
jgi:signal transduction histidine kinase